MNTSSRHICLRAAALALGATGTLATLLAALAPTTDLSPAQPFADLLGQWCTVVLLGCAVWAWAVTLAVLVEAVVATAGQEPTARVTAVRRGLPTGYRRLVLGACGLALSAGAAAPALATPGPVHLGPPAAAAPATSAIPPRPSPSPTSGAGAGAGAGSDIVVRPGDSLWRLAAERLPSDAGDATITHTWHRLYAANLAVIGTDPDHLEPGQRLTRPRVW